MVGILVCVVSTFLEFLFLHQELCKMFVFFIGTGQHVSYFAEHLPNVTWQPSEVDNPSFHDRWLPAPQIHFVLQLKISPNCFLQCFDPSLLTLDSGCDTAGATRHFISSVVTSR